MDCFIADRMQLSCYEDVYDGFASDIPLRGRDCPETLQARAVEQKPTPCWSATSPTIDYNRNPMNTDRSTLTSASTSTESGPSFSSADMSLEEDEKQKSTLQAICDLQSTSQNRFQLLQRFYDLHIGASTTARRLFAYEELDLGNSNKTATTASMDALCIAQIATSFGDGRLKLQARKMYGDALASLNSRIGALHPQHPDPDLLDDIIGAIHALTPCAWFQCTVGSESLEWLGHTQAMIQIAASFGSSIRASTRQVLEYNWAYRAFFNSLSKRVPVTFKGRWTNRGAFDLSSNFLTEYALDVPGLLWRCDKFLQASRRKCVDKYIILRLLTEIGICIARLKHWFVQRVKHFPPRPHYRTTGTMSFKAFEALSGRYSNIVPMAYDFADAAFERDFRILTICLLNLDQAVMDVHAAYPQHCKGAPEQIQLREAEYDAATCATDLCMLIPWSTKPTNMAFAGIHSSLPLHHATRYYERQAKFLQLAWCQQVSRSLTDKYGIEIRWSD